MKTTCAAWALMADVAKFVAEDLAETIRRVLPH